MIRLAFASVIFGIAVGAQGARPTWSLAGERDDVVVWRSLDQPTMRATAQLLEPSLVHGKGLDKADFETRFATRKKQLLRLMGLSGWKTTSLRWSGPTSRPRLDVEGSYTNRRGARIGFREVHSFESSRTLQILVTFPMHAGPNSQAIDELVTLAMLKLDRK